jgi:hypothetical protein
MKPALCRCLNEVLVPDDHTGLAQCEGCGPDRQSMLAEKFRQAKEREAQRIKAADEVLKVRLERVAAPGRKFRPGDKSGAHCPTCRHEYVYGPDMRMLPHSCPGAAPERGPNRTPTIESVQVNRPRMWYSKDDDEDEAA